MQRGRFVTIEGGDGAGKSTNLDCIHKWLAARGHDVLMTREPGGTPLADEIRSLVLAQRAETVDPIAETLLIFAARAQHVATVVRPALRAGTWVLCDRFTDSTFAYQGGGRGVEEAFIAQLAARTHGDCWPDLTIYLDAPVDVATARARQRDQEGSAGGDRCEVDRFEKEQREFFERVRQVFRHRARTHPRIVQVDASQSLPIVRDALTKLLDEHLS